LATNLAIGTSFGAAKSRANGRSCRAAGRYRPRGDFDDEEGSEMTTQETTGEQLWGGETTKAVANFPVSGERVQFRSGDPN